MTCAAWCFTSDVHSPGPRRLPAPRLIEFSWEINKPRRSEASPFGSHARLSRPMCHVPGIVWLDGSGGEGNHWFLSRRGTGNDSMDPIGIAVTRTDICAEWPVIYDNLITSQCSVHNLIQWKPPRGVFGPNLTTLSNASGDDRGFARGGAGKRGRMSEISDT